MKIFTLFLASLIFNSAQAQISKGSILLGGSFGFSFAKDHGGSSDYEANALALRPSLGFVVRENRSIGINFLVARTLWENGANATTKYSEYGSGVFYRLYHPLGKSFYLYGQGEANVSHAKQEASYFNEYRTQTSIELNFLPGIAYALNQRFHLELSLNNMINLGYGWVRSQSGVAVPANSKSNAVYFRVDPNPMSDLALGFQVLLGK